MPYRHDSQDACPQKQAVWSKMARKEENIFQSLMQYKTGHGVQVCLNLFREALQCTRFRLFFLLKKIVVPCFCFSLIVKSTSFMFTTHRITAPVETKALAPDCPSLQKRQIRPSESVRTPAETRWSPGDADRDADRERTSRMPTSGTSAASAGPGPGELSPFAENAWVHKQLQDALRREETGNALTAIQQKEIHKLRKELDLERRDLFDAGDGTGAGSKRKQGSAQPGVAQEALEQVRVKYL